MSTEKNGQTITLDYPVTINGQEVSQLFLRRAKVADQRAMAKNSGTDADKEIAMFANLLNIAPNEVDLLDVKDYQKITEAYQGFLK